MDAAVVWQLSQHMVEPGVARPYRVTMGVFSDPWRAMEAVRGYPGYETLRLAWEQAEWDSGRVAYLAEAVWTCRGERISLSFQVVPLVMDELDFECEPDLRQYQQALRKLN